jgi:ABC-type glycerol-3-phosphate transport system substrate-binding protein
MELRTRNRTLAPRARLATTVAALAAATLALTSCGVGGGEDAAGADELTVVVEGGGLAELQPVADAYEEETGTKVTLVELPYAGLYDRISSELSSGQVSFDVAALDAIWLSAFADGVAPLDDLFTDDVKGDLFPGLVSEAQVDGTFVGMPVWTNSEILFYRTDLFEDPKEQADFQAKYGYELAPPATWEEYRDVAEFFTRDTDGDGQTDLYGTDVKGAVETEWLATVSQAGEEHMVLDAESGEVTIDDAEHVEALDFYTSLLPYAPPGAAQLDWAGSQNLFYQGQLAMMRFWGHAYTGTPEDSVVKDSIGAAPMMA